MQVVQTQETNADRRFPKGYSRQNGKLGRAVQRYEQVLHLCPLLVVPETVGDFLIAQFALKETMEFGPEIGPTSLQGTILFKAPRGEAELGRHDG